MPDEKSIAVRDLPAGAFELDMDPEQLRARMNRAAQIIELKVEFIKNNLKKGEDYGIAHGTDNKMLYKQGAEKLNDWHGYYVVLTCRKEIEDFDNDIFAYTYQAEVRQKGSNLTVAICEGDASSRENKFRYTWVREEQLPQGTDLKNLMSKQYKNDPKKYRVIVENAADKRNTLRQMAQKRAMVAATKLATATSAIFMIDDVEPTDDEDGSTGNGHSPDTDKKDYGDPISEAQGKRLYAIRKTHNIDDDRFKKWLEAKYGLESDRDIGRKIYDEICKVCESGKLEMPAAKKPADAAPKSDTASQPQLAGAKIGIPQIKELSALLGKLHKTEADLRDWLPTFDAKYDGKGMNDVLAEDFEEIKRIFEIDMTGGSV